MNWSRMVVLAAMVTSISGCEGGEAGICDSASLALALIGAEAGDVVNMGSCRIEGEFTVPMGVTLSGEGPSSVLVGLEDSRVVTLELGEVTTVLRNLAIESNGRAGVVSTGEGDGDVLIEDVTVTATRGVALFVHEVAELTIRNVLLDGPITPASGSDVSLLEPDIEETATHGLVIATVDHVELENVSATEFAQFGATIIDSVVTWTEGDVTGNYGVGLGVWGGSAMIDSVTVSNTMTGIRSSSFGAVFSEGAVIDTVDLEVMSNGYIGAIHDGAEAHHHNVIAVDNVHSGLWSQHVVELEVYGAETMVSGNGFAGLMLQEPMSASVRDGTFSSSTPIGHMDGERSMVECADGIQVVRTEEGLGTIELSDLLIIDNERIGLLAETGIIGDTGLEIENVVVSGTTLGAIAQGTDVSDDWDLEITRQGETEVNDAAFSEHLDSALEEITIIGDTGIAGIIGDTG